MSIWSSEQLAVSKAGHDKGKTFLALPGEGDFLLLCDGEARTLEKPKKKKEKHVQMIRHLPQELLEQMQKVGSDADVRRILKEYRKLQSEKGN